MGLETLAGSAIAGLASGSIGKLFGGGAPKAPSAAQIMAMQNASNQRALQGSITASQVNQITPYGSVTYSNTGQKDKYGNPYRQVSQTLSPDQQAILDALEEGQKSAGATANELIGNTFDRYTQAPNLTQGTDNIVNDRLQHQLSYLSPFYKTQTEQLDNRLRNQGLVPGTPAYDNAMRSLRDNQQQSVQSYIASIQPQAFQQAIQEWGLPMESAMKLLGITTPGTLNQSTINQPTFTQQPTNTSGIMNDAYKNQVNTWNNQNQFTNSLVSGLFGQNSLFGPTLSKLGDKASDFIGGLFGV
jgi:hypothetical protein